MITVAQVAKVFKELFEWFAKIGSLIQSGIVSLLYIPIWGFPKMLVPNNRKIGSFLKPKNHWKFNASQLIPKEINKTVCWHIDLIFKALFQPVIWQLIYSTCLLGVYLEGFLATMALESEISTFFGQGTTI